MIVRILALLAIALMCTVHGVGQSNPPRAITFQGVLTDATGQVRQDGQYAVRIALFDVPSGGTPRWSSGLTQITTVRGMFTYTIDIGNDFPSTVPFDKPYWLQVSDGSTVMPRIALTSQPYAFRAMIADRAANADRATSAGVADSAMRAPTQELADGSVTAAKIADATVVRSLNGMQDRIVIEAGPNVVISTSLPDRIIVSATDPTPVGTVVAFMGDWSGTTQANMEAKGWMLCDGAAINRTIHAELLSVIGVTYGPGDGITSFNIPDLRGYFLRGASPTGLSDDQGLARDPGAPRTAGNYQQDALQGHWHQMQFSSGGGGETNYLTGGNFSSNEMSNRADMVIASRGGKIQTDAFFGTGPSGTPRVAAESRPKNIAVNYIIKVK